MEGKISHRPVISSVVILRGLAALGVCAVHNQKHVDIHANSFNYILNMGQQGVAVFFVISGFVLPYSLYNNGYQTKNFFRFLLKRCLRIEPPYWVSILIYFICIPLPISMLTLSSFSAHLFYLIPFLKDLNWYAGIYWTLAIEFQFYVLLGLIYPFLSKLNGYVTCALLMLISLLTLPYQHVGIILSKLYLFTIGYIVFLAYIKKIELIKTCLILISFALVIVLIISITTGLIPLLTAFFILFYKSPKKLPVFFFLGNISYSLYLLHEPVMVMFLRYAGMYTKTSALLFCGSVASALTTAYLFNIFIEQPTIKLSKRISWIGKHDN